MRTAHHVEEQIHIALVDTGQTVQHDDFRIGPVRFVEQVLLVRLLLLHRGKYVLVVVLGQYPVAVVVQNAHSLDGVQGWFLRIAVNSVVSSKTNHFQKLLKYSANLPLASPYFTVYL